MTERLRFFGWCAILTAAVAVLFVSIIFHVQAEPADIRTDLTVGVLLVHFLAEGPQMPPHFLSLHENAHACQQGMEIVQPNFDPRQYRLECRLAPIFKEKK